MRFDNVWLRYGRRAPWVLCGVDLKLSPGEVTILVGRNGAGKSTLLQVAAGVLGPNRGGVSDRPQVVGWVPERFPTEQSFTARTYLRGMAAVAGLDQGEGDVAISWWSERLGCTQYLGERLNSLSKGTAQKIGLIRALLVPPDLLVLDEPWEGLDAQTRDEIPSIVADVVGAGGVVLVSDHRGETARLPGATVWLLEDGVLKDGRLADYSAEDAPSLSQPTRNWVVEVAVTAVDQNAAVERIRAAGYYVVGVREESTP